MNRDNTDIKIQCKIIIIPKQYASYQRRNIMNRKCIISDYLMR